MDDVLQHKWITNTEDVDGTDTPLSPGVKDGLRSIIARSRWKKAKNRLNVVRLLGAGGSSPRAEVKDGVKDEVKDEVKNEEVAVVASVAPQ